MEIGLLTYWCAVKSGASRASLRAGFQTFCITRLLSTALLTKHVGFGSSAMASPSLPFEPFGIASLPTQAFEPGRRSALETSCQSKLSGCTR